MRGPALNLKSRVKKIVGGIEMGFAKFTTLIASRLSPVFLIINLIFYFFTSSLIYSTHFKLDPDSPDLGDGPHGPRIGEKRGQG